MSEPIKLLPEELTKITDIRRTYFNIQNAVGQLYLTRRNLEEQLNSIDDRESDVMEEYKKTQTAEQDTIKVLQDKYGMGTLDVENGNFIPSPTTETAPVEKTTTNS